MLTLSEQLERLDPSKRKKVQAIWQELSEREMEAVSLYEPLPHFVDFHRANCPERVIHGGNRSGKTLAACVEFARAVLGRDPFKKYPIKSGRAFVVGKDGKHISEVLYKKLFLADAFRIIKDKETDLWRAYRPWKESHRQKETMPAPPLLPDRLVPRASIAWESKKEAHPVKANVVNGWEIRFFTSLGKPPQGSDIDYAWFDEEIVDPDWYDELAARLVDREGLFVWSATPQLGGVQFYDLMVKAKDQKDDKEPAIQSFEAVIQKNRHISATKQERFFAKLSDEQYRIRVLGESALTSALVYPEFSKELHCVEYFHVPRSWTRYAFIDPGRQVCAIIAAAVPPPNENHGDNVYFIGEQYVRQCDANKFGFAMKELTKEQDFYAFIIDRQESRKRDTGSGLPLEMQYQEALKAQGVESEITGNAFIWAPSDVQAGLLAARSWLILRVDKAPKLRILEAKMPNFIKEIERYHYKRDKYQITEKPNPRNDHLMDCFRYAALYNPTYHVLTRIPGGRNSVLSLLKAKEERKLLKQESPYVNLGPKVKEAAWT